MIGMFAENGPCEVVQMPDGSYGTQARMWGWDRSSNVLFIDQPAQVRIPVLVVSSRIFVAMHKAIAWKVSIER